jgi:hypothetical protein
VHKARGGGAARRLAQEDGELRRLQRHRQEARLLERLDAALRLLVEGLSHLADRLLVGLGRAQRVRARRQLLGTGRRAVAGLGGGARRGGGGLGGGGGGRGGAGLVGLAAGGAHDGGERLDREQVRNVGRAGGGDGGLGDGGGEVLEQVGAAAVAVEVRVEPQRQLGQLAQLQQHLHEHLALVAHLATLRSNGEARGRE